MAKVDRRGSRPERWTREVSAHRCECGCGRLTMVSPKSDAKRGWVKGEARRFVRGHCGEGRGGSPRPRKVVPTRFEDRGYETPCKIWLGSVDKHGYPRISRGKKKVKAHREAFEVACGPIPAGHDVHHRCEVKLCVEPLHLQALTPEAHKALHEEARRAAC